MQNTAKTGKIGENIAAKYLIRAGFKIICRNYKIGFDEIDIIAKEKDGTLIFFEIKTLNNNGNYLMNRLIPEDNLTGNKLKKVSRACRVFAARYSYLINEERGWRIDLIALTLQDEKAVIMRHYKNIA